MNKGTTKLIAIAITLGVVFLWNMGFFSGEIFSAGNQVEQQPTPTPSSGTYMEGTSGDGSVEAYY